MANDEFSIIRRYFSDIGALQAGTVLGIGDDAAVIELPAGYQQVVSMDTLIAGVHFPVDTAAGDIACKALAVNLSDLAAMAATPAWFLLSLSLPDIDAAWLDEFSAGLRQGADEFGLQLVGGDTCRGELSITIQVAGLVPAGQYVSRAGARPGDLVLVSGRLGYAGLGLASRQGRLQLPQTLGSVCEQALNRPRPRLELADFLRSCASAAIDISDGLQGDLGHILKASGCGAQLDRARLPVDPWLAQRELYSYALGAGDDYEICCTVGPQYREEIEKWNRDQGDCPLTIIGTITETGYGLQVGADNVDLAASPGFRHFD